MSPCPSCCCRFCQCFGPENWLFRERGGDCSAFKWKSCHIPEPLPGALSLNHIPELYPCPVLLSSIRTGETYVCFTHSPCYSDTSVQCFVSYIIYWHLCGINMLHSLFFFVHLLLSFQYHQILCVCFCFAITVPPFYDASFASDMFPS